MTRIHVTVPALILGAVLAVAPGISGASPIESQGPKLKKMWADARNGGDEYTFGGVRQRLFGARDSAKLRTIAPDASKPATSAGTDK